MMRAVPAPVLKTIKQTPEGVMSIAISRRRFLAHTAIAGAGLTMLGARRAAAAPKFTTVTPGTITVAMNGDMPMTSIKDGKLIGTDGEMIDAIAAKLGLTVTPSLMEWSATIASIQSGRADIMLGNMGWTAARAKVMLLTDAVYYPPKVAVMKQDKPFSDGIKPADMKGYSLGTVTGFTIVPELKKVPGTTAVRLYDTTDACIRDVVVGRLDMAFLDAPTMAYLIQQNASWGLKQVPITEVPDFPVLTKKQNTVFGLSGDNPELFDAVNAGVAWLWKTKQNAQLLEKYGISSPVFFVPPDPNPRVGVDRSPDGQIIGPFAHTASDFSSLFA
jgi:ABC-type amino acid transport substrate-binding protein